MIWEAGRGIKSGQWKREREMCIFCRLSHSHHHLVVVVRFFVVVIFNPNDDVQQSAHREEEKTKKMLTCTWVQVEEEMEIGLDTADTDPSISISDIKPATALVSFYFWKPETRWIIDTHLRAFLLHSSPWSPCWIHAQTKVWSSHVAPCLLPSFSSMKSNSISSRSAFLSFPLLTFKHLSEESRRVELCVLLVFPRVIQHAPLPHVDFAKWVLVFLQEKAWMSVGNRFSLDPVIF